MNRFLFRSVLPLAVGVAMSITSVVHADAACELSPLRLPLFDGTPVAELANPSTPAAVPDIDEAEIQSALEQFAACTNTGDPRLAWAMFSPHWFATTFSDPTVHYLPAFEQMLAGPRVVHDSPLQLAGVDAVTPLPDGRVEVTATYTSGDESWTDILTLVVIDGNWMIDDAHPSTPAQ
ncbi:MAG TPA: hypothetical protein VNZ58_06905 [Thermomicrobiales bacterium]|nr:hypothetical protein [Thermomicrobiales bacterium]